MRAAIETKCEIFSVMTTKITVFRDVTLCRAESNLECSTTYSSSADKIIYFLSTQHNRNWQMRGKERRKGKLTRVHYVTVLGGFLTKRFIMKHDTEPLIQHSPEFI
jgi:hypothetical protein